MAGFVMRKDHRFKKLIPIRYIGDDGIAREGMIEDLSLSGSYIAGYTPVSIGVALALHILVPGDQAPLLIARAIVKWVKGSEFGVDFGTPPPKTASQIAAIISRLVETECCSSGNEYTTQAAIRPHPIPGQTVSDRDVRWMAARLN
ncbi:MAG: PilZ domain-containing protein [Nitrospiraceae bacterium]